MDAKRTLICCSTLLAASAAAILAAESSARADGASFGIIVPHEWDYPTEYESFAVVEQYGMLSDRSDIYDANGDKQNMPDSTLLVGYTKVAYFFQIDALPKVGFAAVAMLPEIALRADGSSASGIGDALLSFPVVWYRPIPQLNLGASYWLSVPTGADEVSSHSWSHIPIGFIDLNVGPANLDADFGYSITGTVKKNGAADYDAGNTFFTNVRLAYRDSKLGFAGKFEPFLALDYQKTMSSDMNGATMPDSDGHEVAFGGGLGFYATPRFAVHASYRRTVDGANTPVGDMFYFRLFFLP